MAKVVLTSGLAKQFNTGATELEIEASTVRGIVRALEASYPGIGPLIENELAVAIDGEIYQDPFLEAVDGDSEVFLLPKIGGGA